MSGRLAVGFLKSEPLSVRMITAEDSSKASRTTALPLRAPSQAAVVGRAGEGWGAGRGEKNGIYIMCMFSFYFTSLSAVSPPLSEDTWLYATR